MRSLLTRFFGTNREFDRWPQVIAWWELRRIAFNVILLVSGFISFIAFQFAVNGASDFVHPFTPFLFGFLANMFYTLGWVVELTIRVFSKASSRTYAKRVLKAGLSFSVFCTFVPTLMFTVIGIVHGEKSSSPYYQFTREQPRFDEVVGEYAIDEAELGKLTESDQAIASRSFIRLNSDSTLLIVQGPFFNQSYRCEFVNGKGVWKLWKHTGFNTWGVSISVDSTSNTSNSKYAHSAHNLFLYGHHSPFGLYNIIGDPDEWQGIRFKRATQTSNAP